MTLSLLIIVCWAVHFAFGLRELLSARASLRSNARAGLKAVLVALVFGIAVYATRAVSLRGGHADEHDFAAMSADFLRWPPRDYLTKELSPLALLSAIDRASGYSLKGFLVGQHALWLLSALLLAAALARTGISPGAAACAGGLFLLNFLAVLNTHAFSTANANVFSVASALYVLAALRDELRNRGAALRYCLWLLAAAFLVLTARFEFALVLVWGLGLALLLDGSGLLDELRRGPRRRLGAAVGALGLFLGACALWYDRLGHDAHITVQNYFNLVQNVDLELGAMNLQPLTGLPAEWTAGALGALWIGAAIVGVRRWRTGRSDCFWPIFLCGWILYFSCIFNEALLFPLQEIRHHLYFFMPVAMLLGVLSDEVSARIPPLWGRAALAGFLSVYFVLNLRQARALQGVLRTNDVEWQFLYEAADQWPAGCRVLESAVSDRRRDLLRKYFPTAGIDAEASGGCLLGYSSPADQTLSAVRRPDDEAREDADAACGAIVKERLFTHRFYTLWRRDAGDDVSVVETPDPILVHARFCRVDPKKLRATRTYRRFRAVKLNERGIDAFQKGRYAEALRLFEESMRLDPQSGETLLDAAVTVDALGDEEKALGLYDRAIVADKVAGDMAHRELLDAAVSSKNDLLRRSKTSARR